MWDWKYDWGGSDEERVRRGGVEAGCLDVVLGGRDPPRAGPQPGVLSIGIKPLQAVGPQGRSSGGVENCARSRSSAAAAVPRQRARCEGSSRATNAPPRRDDRRHRRVRRAGADRRRRLAARGPRRADPRAAAAHDRPDGARPARRLDRDGADRGTRRRRRRRVARGRRRACGRRRLRAHATHGRRIVAHRRVAACRQAGGRRGSRRGAVGRHNDPVGSVGRPDHGDRAPRPGRRIGDLVAEVRQRGHPAAARARPADPGPGDRRRGVLLGGRRRRAAARPRVGRRPSSPG